MGDLLRRIRDIFRRSADDESFTLEDLQSDKGRLKAVLESYRETRDFYQNEVNKNFWWYCVLTVITLVGTALTPLLLLLIDKTDSHATFWEALPSGIGGLAAAINVALRFREEWTQSYYTLSAVISEYQRFKARSSPDYAPGKSASEIIDTFQNRMSTYVMSEVESWRVMMLRSETTTRADKVTTPSKIKFDVSHVSRDGNGTGSVLLTKPAPEGGVTVDLTSNGKVALLDKQVHIVSGETTGSFHFKVDPDAFSGDKLTIRATANDTTAAGDVTVK